MIAHSKRNETVPHWMHQACMEMLERPCPTASIYEGHIFDIGQSRTMLAREALKIPETTHILFVDDDIIPIDPLSLKKLFAFLKKTGESIVSGLYYMKQPPHPPLLMGINETEEGMRFQLPKAGDPPTDTVLRVGAVPAGFLLVKREVFEKLEPPWFVYADLGLGKRMKLKGTEQPPGEDIYFSVKATDAGYKLYVDCRVRLGHYVPMFVGPKDVTAQINDGLYESQVERLRKQLDSTLT